MLSIGSRYIYELYYEKEAISKTLYDWLLKNSYADANLIAKWKKQGYEKVCYLSFSQSPSLNYRIFLHLLVTLITCIVFFTRRRRKPMLTTNTVSVMLPALHPDERNQFQLDLHLSCSQGSAQGGTDDRMRQLWLSRLCF